MENLNTENIKDIRKLINTFLIGLLSVVIGWTATEFIKLRDDMNEYKLNYKFMNKTVETLEIIAEKKNFTKEDFELKFIPIFKVVDSNKIRSKQNEKNIEKLMIRLDNVQKDLK